MNCSRPVHINSNSRRYRPFVSQISMEVPCGHCPSCVHEMQRDWFLRTWQECKTYNENGGKVLFVTLTYNNAHLPVYTDVVQYCDPDSGEVVDKVLNIPCFRKSDVDQFWKAFRKPLERYFKCQGLRLDELSLPIKYIWPCEYGMSEGSTYRPHYHPLIFIPREVFEYFGSKQKLKDYVTKHWMPRGFVRWSKEVDGGCFVTSEFAARYVTKYVTKDFSFFSQPMVSEYLVDGYGKVIKDRYEKMKSFLPKHWQSKSFGIGLVDYCNNDLVFRDGFNFTFVSDVQKGKSTVYKVPRYIVRKVLYKQDKHGSFVLNERGKMVKLKLLDFSDKVKKLSEHNSDYINNFDFLKSRVGDIQSFNEYAGTSFFSVFSLSNKLRMMMQGRDINELSLYQLVYRGTIYNYSSPCSSNGRKYSAYMKRLSNFDYNELFNDAKSIYERKIIGNGTGKFYEDGFLKSFNKHNFNLLEKNSRFLHFDEIISLILQVEDFYRKCCDDAYQDSVREKKYLKHLIV